MTSFFNFSKSGDFYLKKLFQKKNCLTLKNQAPDFFQISRCSAQILHNQTVKVSPPSPPALTEFPMSADVKIDVIDEDNAEEDVKDVFRLRFCLM